MSNPFNWIEIPVNDIAHTKMFHEALLGIAAEVRNLEPVEMLWSRRMLQDEYGAGDLSVESPGFTSFKVGSLVYFWKKCHPS